MEKQVIPTSIFDKSGNVHIIVSAKPGSKMDSITG